MNRLSTAEPGFVASSAERLEARTQGTRDGANPRTGGLARQGGCCALGGDRETWQATKGAGRVCSSAGLQILSNLAAIGVRAEPGFQAIDQPSNCGAITTVVAHASAYGETAKRNDYYIKSGQNASSQGQRWARAIIR